MSRSVSPTPSTSSQNGATSPPTEEPQSFYVQALYAYSGVDTSSLSFRPGDVIEVLSTLASGWWDGVLCEQKVRGWFPSNYVQRLDEDEARWAREQMMGWWEGEEESSNNPNAVANGNGKGKAKMVMEGEDELNQFMNGSAGEVNFSDGGNIFSEIAEAARRDHSNSNNASPNLSRGGETSADEIFRRESVYTTASDRDDEEDEDVDEEDYWVPKVTHQGQLFYYNSRSGETSRDMPIDGKGDGIRIDPSQFELDDQEREAVQTRRPSAYSNNDRRQLQAGVVPQARRSTGDTASLLSAWTERPRVGPGGDSSTSSLDQGAALRRNSVYSQSFNEGSSTIATTATNGNGSGNLLRSGLEPGMIDRMGHNLAMTSLDDPSDNKARSSRVPRRKNSTADLLEPSTPPLLSDLESDVSAALQDLIDVVGVHGLVGRRKSSATDNPSVEREVLAQHGDGVVTAVRSLLHASGVLEHPILKGVASSAMTATRSLSSTSSALAAVKNEIRGNFSRRPVLSPAAQAELKPATRRVTSTLSKLVLSVRAVWGLLETIPADQILDHEDVNINGAVGGSGASNDPDEIARRDDLGRRIISEWAKARDLRYEIEAKLRSEVLVSARDVQVNVVNFLNEFDRVVGSSAVGEDGAPLALVRAPKAITGTLRTNAAALLLPGGGFGGNWRGNGFVTLPSPHTTPNPSTESNETPVSSLSYAYPSSPISSDAAANVQKDSMTLVEQANSLRTLVDSLRGPNIATKEHDSDSAVTPDAATALTASNPFAPPTSPALLMDRAAQVHRQLAMFLNQIEDIDVAAGVDFELANETPSRPASRREDRVVNSSDAASTDSDKESLRESLRDSIQGDSTSAEYRASVLEARPLLADFEIGKQALYDIAPRMLCALQELYMASQPSSPRTGTLAPHPPATAPLSAYSPPTQSQSGKNELSEILIDLATGASNICVALTALSAIAEVQAAAPNNLRRQNHNAARTSTTLDGSYDASASSSSLGHSLAHRQLGAKNSQSPASSRQSLLPDSHFKGGAPSTHSRESVDSDFFFSGSNAGTGSGTASSVKTRSSLKQILTNAGLRRSSIATTSSDPAAPDLQRSITSSPVKTSTPTTPSSKLAKLTGETHLPTSPPKNMPEPTPLWLGPDYNPDDVSFNIEGQVRGGTLKALMIAGTSHEGRVDSSYLSAFLMTYRTFCTSHELLDLLIERYLVPVPEGLTPEEYKIWETRKLRPIRARVANLIKSWVREYMEFDERDPELLRKIAAFAAKTMSDPVQSPQIIKVVEERLAGVSARPTGSLAPGPLPPSIVPRTLRKLKFMDIDPLEMARQLTIMDGRLFAKITPQECLGKAWPKQFGSDAPNISAMIDMSNAVTRWVTETILLQEDLKKRAAIVKHFILIAERCLQLNNFSTLIHIIAGLNSTPIHRLRRTWEQVSQKSMMSLSVLNNVMRPDKNYKEYREQLRQVAPPCVPFLGVYLTDWTFIGDGNPDMLRERPHQINFNKRQKASELILMIKLHQATSYNLAAVPVLAKFIDEHLFPPHAHPATDDQRLYELSLTREPRERDDEKIARLLLTSGFL